MSSTRQQTTRLFHVYVAGVIVGWIVVVAALARSPNAASFSGPNGTAFAILAGCLAFGELRPLKWLRRHEGGELTISWTFAFAILLIASPLAALVSVSVASIAGDMASRKPLVRSLFNAAQV